MRRRVLASGLAALTLVACNAILGLDGDTVIASADAAVTETGSDATPDVIVVPPNLDGGHDAGDAKTELGAPGITLAAGVLGGEGTADGPSDKARFRQLTGVVVDKNGHSYVIDGSGTVLRKIEAKTGIVSTLAGKFDDAQVLDGLPGQARFEQISGLAYDGDHLLYVTERLSCRLRTVDTGTGQVTSIISGCGDSTASEPKLKGPTGLTIWSDADTSTHVVFIADAPSLRAYDIEKRTLTDICGAEAPPGPGDCKTHRIDGFDLAFDPTTHDLYYRQDTQLYRVNVDAPAIDVLSGNIIIGVDNDDLSNTLFHGTGLALGEVGTAQLYVGNGLAVDVGSVKTNKVSHFVGTNSQPPASVDGPNDQNRFEKIGGVFRLGPTNYEIADRTTVRVATSSGVQTIAGRGRAIGYVDNTRDAARLDQFFSPTLGPNGLVYFYDRLHATVRSYDPANGAVKTVAGQHDVIGTLDGDAGTSLLDQEADGIVFDGTSIIYSSTAGAFIRSIEPTTGEVKTISKTAGLGAALAFDGTNRVYTVGSNRQSVVEWTRDTPDLRKPIAGLDGTLQAPQDGTGTGAIFGEITGLCFDASLGAIFAVDQAAFSIRKIRLDGTVTTVAGTLAKTGYVDATGQAARFRAPDEIACDGKGHAFVNEPKAGTIRRVDLVTGEVKTVAGVLDRQGIALGALPGSLNQPLGPIVLPNGHLLVGSLTESAIVEITLAP